MKTKILSVLCVVSVVIVGVLQWEIANLNSELENIRRGDTALSAAFEKFENDLAAKQRAEEKAKLGALAEQEAARRKNIDAGLNALPSGSFRQPAYWNGNQSEQKPNN
jgi:hypothetical protein